MQSLLQPFFANGVSVNARVIEAWTCHAAWSEYQGIKAPENEPVLTLVGSNDPWFQNSWSNGSCAEFLSQENGSKSIVYSEGNLSYQHELLENDEVQKVVLDFLQQHIE